MFAPFYPSEITAFGLRDYFEKLSNFDTTPSIAGYVQYLKQLSKTYHDNIPIDKNSFLSFLVELLITYSVVNKDKMDDNSKNEFRQSLSQEIYGK